MASPAGDRVAALSKQLAQTHQELRRRLSRLRARTESPGPASDNAADLRTHCLAFCGALTTHHQGEDTGLFAALLRERPDLKPTIDKLVQDHGLITGILTRVAELDTTDPAAVTYELDGLAAIMESHFRYEERVLAQALDAGVPDDGWSDPVLRLEPPRPTE